MLNFLNMTWSVGAINLENIVSDIDHTESQPSTSSDRLFIVHNTPQVQTGVERTIDEVQPVIEVPQVVDNIPVDKLIRSCLTLLNNKLNLILPRKYWCNLKKDEMSSMKCNDVWDLVELPNGVKPLVETFSPVSKKDSLRIILALVAHFDLELQQMDVKTTFLNGELEEEVYMKQPEGFPSSDGEQLVCKLKKSIYGLKQASRQWSVGVKFVFLFYTWMTSYLQPMIRVYFMSRKFDVCSVCTRPDIAFAVGMLGRYQSNPGIDHWKAAKKVMRYLQGTKDYKLMYRRTSNLEVVGYSDSDFAGCVDSRKSTSGYIFILAGGAISWRSVKQTMTATSTMEAEFISCFEATSHGVWLKSFISGLRVMDSISRPLSIYCDNSTAVFMAKNNKSGSRSKHIDIKY
ncbi:Retrovirus-related Pol polyprotein from transposon TNT 1-94 [Vitis vinifera]|uniref:Retrovirus-related Pol polyprotein from transposon TNT 1-94 n=1 Tax=Vitis vinifera TaxID=29760 RepID=A0A438I0C7_VITVI|nr:Retrovirus-related Pol polyprotein from transposon TNT 1-94 [Vitis vinifera]